MENPGGHLRAVGATVLLVGVAVVLGFFSFGLLAAVVIPTAIRHWWEERRDGDSFEFGAAVVALTLVVVSAVGVWWFWDAWFRWEVDHSRAEGRSRRTRPMIAWSTHR